MIALHPDETTESIVDFCVSQQKPFVVVPCCVFSRLFSQRMWKGKLVTNYWDFIDYLKAKHPSIQMTKLDFVGANNALWSVF